MKSDVKSGVGLDLRLISESTPPTCIIALDRGFIDNMFAVRNDYHLSPANAAQHSSRDKLGLRVIIWELGLLVRTRVRDYILVVRLRKESEVCRFDRGFIQSPSSPTS